MQVSCLRIDGYINDFFFFLSSNLRATYHDNISPTHFDGPSSFPKAWDRDTAHPILLGEIGIGPSTSLAHDADESMEILSQIWLGGSRCD